MGHRCRRWISRSTAASSAFEPHAEALATWVQTIFREALDRSPHRTTPQTTVIANLLHPLGLSIILDMRERRRFHGISGAHGSQDCCWKRMEFEDTSPDSMLTPTHNPPDTVLNNSHASRYLSYVFLLLPCVKCKLVRVLPIGRNDVPRINRDQVNCKKIHHAFFVQLPPRPHHVQTVRVHPPPPIHRRLHRHPQNPPARLDPTSYLESPNGIGTRKHFAAALAIKHNSAHALCSRHFRAFLLTPMAQNNLPLLKI
jgi:hypothetical protein